jgi:hypothetical protein
MVLTSGDYIHAFGSWAVCLMLAIDGLCGTTLSTSGGIALVARYFS